MYTAGPNSQVTWGSGIWNGGIIGGRSTFYITESMILSGTGKTLRYACRLHVLDTAIIELTSGNVSLSDGANVVIDGGFLAIHDVFPNPKDGGRPPYEIYKLAISSKKFKEVETVKSLRILQRVS